MARQQRHLRQLGDVPGADDDAARVGVGLRAARRRWRSGRCGRRRASARSATGRRRPGPRSPSGARPLVPDRDAALLQPARVAVAAQEPEQLEDDRAQVHLLGRDQREAFAQVEAHLVAEHAASCRCRCGPPWRRRGRGHGAGSPRTASGSGARRRRSRAGAAGLHGPIIEASGSAARSARAFSVELQRREARVQAADAPPARHAFRSRRSRPPRGRRSGRRAARSRGGAR